MSWEEEGTSSLGCSVASAASVGSTPSMCSMLFLGGSGGMPPRKICKDRHQEIEFGGNLASKQASMTLILLYTCKF